MRKESIDTQSMAFAQDEEIKETLMKDSNIDGSMYSSRSSTV